MKSVGIHFRCEIFPDLQGHSLGYFHEHTRFDRDAHVKVLSQNIESGYASQFSENPPSAMVTFGVGYDLGSAMHYPTNV